MPAYLIARVQVTDPLKYEDYKKLAPIAVKKFGGRYLARGGETATVEGPEETRRVAIVEFKDMETAKAFYNSPEYQKAKAAREGAAEGQFTIVESL